MTTLPTPLLALGVVLLAAALVGLALALRPAGNPVPGCRLGEPTRQTGIEPPAPAPVPPRPMYPPIPPKWYRAEYDAVRTVLTEGRTVIARCWVSTLIDDSLLTFGDDHPYTRWAWELLAEIVRTELDHLDRTGLTLEPHGSSDPFGTILFPKGSGYTVVRDLDQVSVYRTAGAGR